VIVALHVATGAAAGAASRSRLAALLLGPVLHLAGDRLPHQDFRSRRFEIGSGLAGLLLLAASRGPFDPATLGAAASSAPDLEHVLPFLRPGGRTLFHYRGWHRSGRLPAGLQLLLAGAILGALIAPGSRAVEAGRRPGWLITRLSSVASTAQGRLLRIATHVGPLKSRRGCDRERGTH
jgi:hypothetical protein